MLFDSSKSISSLFCLLALTVQVDACGRNIGDPIGEDLEGDIVGGSDILGVEDLLGEETEDIVISSFPSARASRAGMSPLDFLS